MKSILLIGEDEDFNRGLSIFLKKLHFSVSVDEIHLLNDRTIHFDLVIYDPYSSKQETDESTESLERTLASIPFIVIAPENDYESVVRYMKLGALDYVVKPTNPRELQSLYNRIVSQSTISLQIHSALRIYQELIDNYESRMRFSLVSASPAMMSITEQIAFAATRDDLHVVITGEHGVGKEAIAKNIHSLSSRRHKPWIKMNCAQVLPINMESELFGNTKNIFTGVKEDKIGILSAASGGVVYLEDISEMPLDIQKKLVSASRTGKYKRIGTDTPRVLDVRFILSASVNSEAYTHSELFADEFLQTFKNISIDVIPLRERKEDILLLAKYFIQMYAEINQRSKPEISTDVQQLLITYPFQGNVTELRNMVRKAMVLSDHDAGVLYREDFPDLYIEKRKHELEIDWGEGFRPLQILDETEKQWILNAMKFYHNNKTHVAKALHITRQSLNRRIDKHGIQTKENK